MLMNWKKYFIVPPALPCCVFSQFLWYNNYIKIDTKAVSNFFSTKNISFIIQLFNTDGSVKNWNFVKTKYTIQDKDQFCWLQEINAINAIPEMWKNVSKKYKSVLVCWYLKINIYLRV